VVDHSEEKLQLLGAEFDRVWGSALKPACTLVPVPRLALDGMLMVFSVDTRDPAGGMYTVRLTYLAWGFDWQAHYVATLEEPGRDDQVKLRLMSWLTLLNDNGQGFPNAELLVVAGRLNVVSDFEGLADPPDARPLSLTCYPLGSTAAGSPIDQFHSAPPRTTITVRHSDVIMDSISESLGRVPGVAIGRFADAKKAEEEALGDLKLYRVPERVNVAAKSLKQVVFLDQDAVEGRLLYKSACSPWDAQDEALPAAMLLATVNDRSHGLGMALPMGGVTVFEPSSFGDQLVAEERLRDYAEGQDVEIALGMSSRVFARCERTGPEFSDENPTRWSAMRATLSNANRNPARVRLVLGPAGEWQLRGLSGTRVKDGEVILEVTVPGNGRREVSWELRPVGPI
jgi:hypothetical protein